MDDIGDGVSLDSTPQKATPIFYTVSGLPVFAGTTRWKTNIVAISQNKFAVINITGSGWTKVIDPLSKTFMTSDSHVSASELNAAIKEEISASNSN